MPYKSPEERRRKQAEYRECNREKLRERHRAYYWEHREHRLESGRRSREKHRHKKRERDRRYNAQRRQSARQRIFDILGAQCVRCGYDTDVRALQIDRILDGGGQGRRAFKSLLDYYGHIVEVNAAGYQILCANCKQIKRYEKREARESGVRNQESGTPGGGEG